MRQLMRKEHTLSFVHTDTDRQFHAQQMICNKYALLSLSFKRTHTHTHTQRASEYCRHWLNENAREREIIACVWMMMMMERKAISVLTFEQETACEFLSRAIECPKKQ